MKKGQLSKHCRIFQWVEDQDPKFAEAIRQLCLEGALSPNARTPGVTFLYPKDAAYRQEIYDKAYSDDPDAAVKMVEALIVPDVMLQAGDFSRRPVGNRCGVAFKVESAGNGKVLLADGVELAPSSFATMASRTGALAVWLVAKGRLPQAGAPYTPPASAPRRPGGPAHRTGGGGNERALLASATEAEYDCCAAKGTLAECNPYLAKVVSLLNFLKANRPELLDVVRPVLDYEPVVSFYLLFEPYKTQGAHLVPNSVLFGDGAWNCADAYGSAVAEFEAFFREDQKSAAAPFMYRDRAAVAAQVDQIRRRIGAGNQRSGPQAVQDVYAVLAAQNTIGGMGPILPAAAQQALAGSKKLWQDEFRFTVHEALQSLRAAPYSSSTFGSIVRDLRAAWPGNDYGAEIRLANVADLRANIAPRLELTMLMKFINSTDFLYLPVAPDAVGAAWGSMDPTDWAVYNRNAVALANLRRVTGMSRASGISPQALQELRIYAGLHGGLPPEVAAMGTR